MDLLVRLYDLPDASLLSKSLGQKGVHIRRAMAYEKAAVLRSVEVGFGRLTDGWVSECDIAFSHLPISCFIAAYEHTVIGFACYDCTLRGFFGPMGIASAWRGQGIGKALLLAALNAMRMQGYGYAVVGNAGPTEFFQKAAGAIEIPGSEPGIYVESVR